MTTLPLTGQWVVAGINPEPWTAPEVNIGRRGKKIVPIVYKREQVRAYQEAVADYIKGAHDPSPFHRDTPLEVSFYFWRQLERPNSKHADATNLQKSTEDALHDLLFENDRQVKRVHTTIVEQATRIEPLVVVIWGPWQDTDDIDHWRSYHKALDSGRAPVRSNERDIEPEKFF